MSGIAVGTMTSLHFLGSHPLARTITDSNQHSRDFISRNILAGNYRVLNDASKKCLSFSTRPIPLTAASRTSTPRVSGWACGVPGIDDDLHQIWTVRQTPTKPPASSTASTNPQIGQTSPGGSVPGGAPAGSTNIPTGVSPATSPVPPSKTSSLSPGGPSSGAENVTTGPSSSLKTASTAAAPANPALAAPPIAPQPAPNPQNSGGLNPPIAQSTSPKRYKNSVVFESLDFASTAGAGHAFRLDFANVATPIVNPDIPSGRDQIPNGVTPPTNPVFKPIAASTPPTPPTPAPVIPSLSSYTRQLDVLPQGADTSSFQILSTGIDNLFLIYCPSNGTFIGHTPSTSGMDGSPIQATDLNKYILDIEAFLVAQKGVGSKDVLSKIKTELGFWVWSLVRADFGPARNAFRIVHDQTKLALDSKVPKPGSFVSSGVESAGSAQGAGAPLHGLKLHTNAINPAASSQIWDTLPFSNSDTASIIHTINNHVDQSPIVPSSATSKNSWRMIYIPTAQPTVGNAPSVPSPSPIVPAQYLLFNTDQRSFLGLQSHAPGSRRGSSPHSPSTPSSRSAPLAFEAKSGQVQEFHFSFDDVPTSFHDISTRETSPHEINPVLALLYQDVERFRNNFDWLIWRILPVEWAPADGIYTIQSIPSTTYLDIPETIFASPCPLSLNAAYPFPSIGSEWWRIASHVDPDSGTIYQTVANYRSGHIIDNSAGSLVGRRSGSPKDEKWRFVSPAEGGLSFAFMDYATLSNGVVVGVTGKSAVFAVTDSKDLLWKISKVDLGVSDGSYYIRDLKSRQYLSRNSQKKQQEPLLLTSNPTSWAVSTVSSASGVRLTRIFALGDPNCVLFAPPLDSIFADLPSPGEIFAITNYDNEIPNTFEGAQFEIECDFTTGESSILSKSLQKYLSVSAFTDDEKTLAVSFISGKDAPKEWEFIPVTPANRNWALPTWLLKNKSGIPNLADGVYRITNGQTKNCLALGAKTTTERTKGVKVTGNLKEAAVDQLWYFQRDRNPVITPQLQTYTVTSLERPLVLQERVENIGQPVEGLQLWAGPRDLLNASVTASQKWMIWKQSALTWCLQAVGGSGGLLDIGTGNLPCTTPLLTSTPSVLQTWQLNRALPEVSGGYYRIRNQFTQSFISEHGLDVVASSYAFYGKTASDFRLAALPNGLCHLQSMSSLQYLSCNLVLETAAPVFVPFTNPDDLSSCWLLLPTKDGLLIQNALTRTNLTTTHGSAEDGVVMELLPGAGRDKKGPTPWQVFSFERVDSPSPAFNDLSSDKIAAGQYTVTNVSSGQQLCWASSSSATSGIALGTAVICKPPVVSNPNFWTIAPSGTGYYSFSLSAFPLGLNLPTSSQPVPVAGVGISGLDSSMWKLLKFDTGNYRIINKDNGLLLLQDSTGKVLLGPGDNKANQQNEWKLDLNSKPSTAVSIPAKSADRELQPTNGLYLFSNSQSSNVFTMSTPTTTPTVTPRDLEASSVEGRKQVWIVEMNRDNWFTIKSFPFGMSLAFNDSASSLVFGSDDGSISFQWKFLQDTATSTMRIVPRNRPNLVIAPDLNNALSLVSYSGLPLQRWTMIRSSGTSADTKLAQGVYTISLYQAPNPFGLQTQASTVSTAVQTDKQYNDNLNTIADSASHVASGLTSTFPAPALPADVVLGTVLDTLETSDFKDAPAALGIASWFYATLNGVTKAAPPAAPAASTRVMAISDSLVKISQILVNASTIGSTITAASGAKQINDITSTTSLLTDTSSQGLQNGILAAAQQFLSGLNTYIQTLPPPASLASDVDPSTPSTITQGDGDDPPVIRSPLAAQSLPQYWLVASAGADLFTVSHLTSKKYLAYDKTTASSTQQGKIILQTNAYNWRFTNQRLGGYAIISAVDSNIAICMPVASSDVNGETFVADGTTGAQRQRWSLLRSGYYLQNQEPQNWNKVVTKNATGNDVFLTPYRPFGANTLLNGIRSDALCIWHLVKVDTGKYCFYNEASKTVLRNGGDNVVVVAGDLQQQGGDIWQFAKNGNDMWFAPGNVNNQKWMSTNGADGQTIVVNDPGGKESWKGWQLISVAATERGILMNLPRCILNPRNTGSGNLDASLVVSIDPQNPSGPFVQRQYKPDDSYQRFRIYTYAKYSFYINEATAGIVKAGGGTADLSGVADQSAWFTSDSSQNISCLQSNVTPLFANAISNTGDLGSSNLSVRIQIGKVPGDTSVPPRVLSVDSTGTPIAEPWDRLSAQQVWSYLDWDKGRYIIHTPTSKLLALSGYSLVLLAPGSYTQDALWKNDYRQASTAGINGFFPIQPATPSTSMIPTGITESNGALTISPLPQFGFRFIPDSSWFIFTDRLALLNTFLTSHNPVFCHAKGAPLPTSVDSYLASSTLNNGPVPTPLPTLPGDYVLTYSGPPSNGSSAVAYIVVRSTTEPIYINYTDISYYLLYPPSLSPSTTGGWTYITMRFNNYSNLLSSVYFPSLGWIYNLDLSTDPSATNPLSIIKRADGTTKLHVQIGSDLQPVPGFGTMLNSDIINATNWGFVLDSSQSANNVLLEVGMIRDDEVGSRPVPPGWARYKGAWVAGGVAGAKFPGAV